MRYKLVYKEIYLGLEYAEYSIIENDNFMPIFGQKWLDDDGKYYYGGYGLGGNW